MVATGEIVICCHLGDHGGGYMLEGDLKSIGCGPDEITYGVGWKGEAPGGQRVFGLNWEKIIAISKHKLIKTIPSSGINKPT